MALKTSWLRQISAAKSLRAGVRAGVVPACLMLLACTVQTGLPGPNVVLNTPTGPVAVNSPAPGPPGGGLAVPPGLQPAPPAPAQPVSRDGTYAGSMEALSTAGGVCSNQIKVTGFRVRGSAVRFGSFRGTIASDGGLQMVFGGTWIIGQFEGATFHGQVQGASGRGGPGCSYILTLDRTGP